MNPVPDVPAGTGLYPIVDVDGRQPDIPTDFIGASMITVAVAGEPRRLVGLGELADRGLEFHQGDVADAAGPDVAAWAIAEAGDEAFLAEPLHGPG